MPFTPRAVVVLLVTLAMAGVVDARKPVGTLHSLTFRDVERSYFRYEPESLGTAPPVLVLLHGSGRDGDSLIREWRQIADAEGLLLVAPNSADPMEWSPLADPPSFLRAVLDDVAGSRPVDRNRVYLFGHSAGAVWALQVGLMSSTEIAAVAVHAGLIPDPALPLIEEARRKIPVSIQVGARDPFFPVAAVRVTVDRLIAAGFAPELVEIRGHDHDYYSKAKKVNPVAWAFLKAHTLGEVDP